MLGAVTTGCREQQKQSPCLFPFQVQHFRTYYLLLRMDLVLIYTPRKQQVEFIQCPVLAFPSALTATILLLLGGDATF